MMMMLALEEDFQNHKAAGERRAEVERAAAQQALRDQFAMAALTGLLSDPTPIPGYDSVEKVAAEYGRLSYLYADAMLAARGGK